MLQCRALVTFNSRYGLLRRGERCTVEPDYFVEANRKIPQLEEIQARNEPKHRAVVPQAPRTKKALSTESVPPSSLEPGAPLIDGQAKPSAVSPPVLRSRKKTSTLSEGNVG